MMSYFFLILHFSLLKFSFQLHDYTRSRGNSNSSDVLKNAGRRLGIVDMAGKMGKRKAMACAMVFFLSSACRYTCKFNGNIICRCIIFNCFTIDAVSISAFHPNIYMNNCSIVVYFFGDFYYNFTGCNTNSFTFFLSNCLLK